MLEGWRWFGPEDPVSLDAVRQAGASEIVSALNGSAPGGVWTRKDVAARRDLIESGPPGRSQLNWSVIESIPVPDDVKRLGGRAKASVEGWIESMVAAAAEGPKRICYNFMPVVDWTRTDLDYVLPTGGTALRFDQERFAAFELYILARKGAEAEYSDAAKARAKAVYEAMSEAEVDGLIHTIASALPGSTTDPLSLPAFRDRLASYRDIDAATLRRHLIEFLDAVTPVAEQHGVTLTLHPDDPPRPLFGLPRIASSMDDFAVLFDAVPSPSNGMCFCTGSLGVRADNDLIRMAEHFAKRIHFVHLRSTKREEDGMSFHEAEHLDGDVDMVGVIMALLSEDNRREPGRRMIFRPDHGHRLLDDLSPDKRTFPGYTAIGRLKGLAELRGVMRAVRQLS